MKENTLGLERKHREGFESSMARDSWTREDEGTQRPCNWRFICKKKMIEGLRRLKRFVIKARRLVQEKDSPKWRRLFFLGFFPFFPFSSSFPL